MKRSTHRLLAPIRAGGLLIALAATAGARPLAPDDPDRDGDGLSDFQEVHKYRTDPDRADSDGDGIPDGDWNERREYTYSLRTVVRVLPPVSVDHLCDDYQDAIVVCADDAHYELEVVHYPLNTVADAIEAEEDWQLAALQLREYLTAGPTTNWDEEMALDLRQRLAGEGIQLASLSDRRAVEQVSRWALRHAEGLQTFTTFLVHCPDGRPEIYPGLEDKFQRKKYRSEWSVQDQLQHEVLGKGMYENGTRGSCTSSAVYLSTVLRAAGIPTRMILTIPAVDASNPAEVALVERGVRHHEVRETMLRALRQLGQSFAAHTYNEVWVGGRWRRLNYERLGQNTLDAGCMGLMTKIMTFKDLADAGLAPTWGTMSLTGWNRSMFRHSNPYSAISVDDRFGMHADIANPPAQDREHAHAEIVKVYWFDSDSDRPDFIPADGVADDGHGHVLMQAKVWLDDEGAGQYGRFWEQADKEFTLLAKGAPKVKAEATRGYWANHFYLRIAPTEYRKMKSGVEYRLKPRNRNRDHQWKIEDDVVLLGRAPGEPPPAAPATEGSNPKEHWMEDGGHRHAVIADAYWFDSPERDSDLIPDDAVSGPGGHLFLHARHWVDGVNASQYATFWQEVDKRYQLVARGERKVSGEAQRGYWKTEFYVYFEPKELAKLKPGVEYELVPRNRGKDHQWLVDEGVIVRAPGDDGSEDHGDGELRSRRAARSGDSMTFTKLRRANSPDLPDWVLEVEWPAPAERILLAHVAEWDEERGSDPLMEFTRRADRSVQFEAEGAPAIQGEMLPGCLSSSDGEMHDVVIVLPEHEAEKIRSGVRYVLVPRNESEARWQVREGLEFEWQP